MVFNQILKNGRQAGTQYPFYRDVRFIETRLDFTIYQSFPRKTVCLIEMSALDHIRLKETPL